MDHVENTPSIPRAKKYKQSHRCHLQPQNQTLVKMDLLSLDNFDASKLMAEAILKKKAEKKKGAASSSSSVKKRVSSKKSSSSTHKKAERKSSSASSRCSSATIATTKSKESVKAPKTSKPLERIPKEDADSVVSAISDDFGPDDPTDDSDGSPPRMPAFHQSIAVDRTWELVKAIGRKRVWENRLS